MSHLFDEYRDKNTVKPLKKEYRFLNIKKAYEDLLSLGVDNEHSFVLPYEFDELKRINITYVQGTDLRLTKDFEISSFVEEEHIEDKWTKYVYKQGGALLATIYEIETKYNPIDWKLLDFNLHRKPKKYCILYYNLFPIDTLSFNDYNKEVYAQVKLMLDSKYDDEDVEKSEFSRQFKLKLRAAVDYDSQGSHPQVLSLELGYEVVD